MSTELTTTTPPPAPLAEAKPAGRALTRSGVAHHTTDDLWKTAQMLVKTGMVPKSYQGKPELAMAAMITGIELGYSPAAALRCVAVVNGSPTVWGTGGYALPMSNDDYEGHEVTYQLPGEDETELEPELPTNLDEIPDGFRVICRVYRRGHRKSFVSKFSVADAKRARLWGMTASSGAAMPWCQYPARMMMHKAVGNALESAFPDSYFNIGKDLDQEFTAPEEKPTTVSNGTTYLKQPKQKPVKAEVAEPTPTPEPTPEPEPETPAETAPEEPAPEPTPEPKKETKPKPPNTKQILAEFAINYPAHTEARITKDDQKLLIRCTCGGVWEVKDIAGVITFPIITRAEHTEATEPEPAPPPAPAKKEKLGADPGEDEMKAQIEALDPTELGQFFEEKLKQLAKANLNERRKGCKPLAHMIRTRLKAASTIIHVSQVLQWISRATFVLTMDGETLEKLKQETQATQDRIKAGK